MVETHAGKGGRGEGGKGFVGGVGGADGGRVTMGWDGMGAFLRLREKGGG